MISQVDLFETILEYAGISEAKRNDHSSSRSFTAMLRDEALPWEDEVFMEQEELGQFGRHNGCI